MSASDKKRIRREQNSAAMTEKQLLAQKEAKKLKAYTISFIVAMVLVVAIVVGVVVTPVIGGIVARNTHALTVGGHKLSTTMLTYYYVDSAKSFYQDFADQYGEYADVYAPYLGGIVSTKPLNEQIKNPTTKETWADHFIHEAKDAAQWTMAIYNAAMEDEDFKLDEETQKFLDGFEDNIKMYATISGFQSAEGYPRSTYGDAANMKTYKEYYTYNTIANEYAAEYLNALEFDDEDYREHEKDKYHEYNSYSYISYYVNSSAYLTYLKLGTTTKDENGKETTTYDDEDKAEALAAAKKDAEALAVTENASLDKLNAAIAALDINKDKKDEEKPKATSSELVVYAALAGNKDIQKWLSDDSRKTGDITIIEYKTKDSNDKDVVNGYYVVVYQTKDENLRKLADVRHILVKFTGGKKDETTGETVYSDEEKATAKKKAEFILEQYNNTDKKEADFEKLAKEKSEDSGSKSNGGLIEGIYRDANYVEPFIEWAIKPHEVGDTGIIETVYGYHVMYYKGDDELSYRDFMIDHNLTQDAYDAWQESLTEKTTVTEVNLSGIDRGYTIAG